MTIFDEYTEEINDKVMYGILYQLRMGSKYIDRNMLDTNAEEMITLQLKAVALKKIYEDITAEQTIVSERLKKLTTKELR